jgi:PIN domain-containing protein
VIVLDTNVLEGPSFKSLEGPLVGVLLAVARARREDILLPQIVVDEFLAHRRHDVDAAIETARAAATKLAKLVPAWAAPSQWPDPESVITPVNVSG